MQSDRALAARRTNAVLSLRGWLAWWVGLSLFAVGNFAALHAGSRVWLVWLLTLALAFAAFSFPGDRKLELRLMALGFYAPIVTVFYVRSLDRLPHHPATWVLLVGGTVVLSLTSLAGLLRIEAARKALPWLIGAGICGLLIGFFSGGRGGADPWMHYFMREWGLERWQAVEVVHYLRKSIHFTFYGTLAWFAAKGASAAGATPRWALLFGLLWGLPHAIFDETRQAFSPGRSASSFDVMLDFSGMLFFTLAFWRNPMRPADSSNP